MDSLEGCQTIEVSFDGPDSCGKEKEDVFRIKSRNVSEIEDILTQPVERFGHQNDPIPEMGKKGFNPLQSVSTLGNDETGHPIDLSDRFLSVIHFEVEVDIGPSRRNNQGNILEQRDRRRLKEQTSCPKSMMDMNERGVEEIQFMEKVLGASVVDGENLDPDALSMERPAPSLYRNGISGNRGQSSRCKH